ncbi:hypothetical protein EI94DRAFT_1702592 [Lactarius quietus]|nr:hypothetical protein EI94DRAFT_1702592 [Lactarius quietus]
MPNSISLALVRLKASFRRLLQELHKPDVLGDLLKGRGRTKPVLSTIHIALTTTTVVVNVYSPHRGQCYSTFSFLIEPPQHKHILILFCLFRHGKCYSSEAPPTTTIAHPYILQPASELKGLAGEKRPTSQQLRELFDCQVNLDTGTIVLQPTQIKPWKLTGLLNPVFFIMRNGFLGVPYKDLSARKFLYNAAAHVPPLLKRPNLNARTRILVSQLFLSASVMLELTIFDQKLGKDVPITVSRLVERVVRGLHRLYLVRLNSVSVTVARTN